MAKCASGEEISLLMGVQNVRAVHLTWTKSKQFDYDPFWRGFLCVSSLEL